MSALLISVVAFICVVSLIAAAAAIVADRRDPVKRRLMAFADAPAFISEADGSSSGGWMASTVEPLLVRFGITSWHAPGVRTGSQRVALFLIMIAASLGVAALVGRVFAFLHLSAMLVAAGSFLAAWWAAAFTVRYWMRRYRSYWLDEINNNIIDVIDLWVLCLGAGMSFAAALVRVSQDDGMTSPALREELVLTNQEMLAGCSREDALRHLVRRCGDSADLRALVSHIIQSERLGSSLTDTLRIYAQSLRFKRTQDTKEMIQTLPLKLTFPLVFCILPALFVIILGPSVIRMFEVLTGR
jgi:tight adherence protein C